MVDIKEKKGDFLMWRKETEAWFIYVQITSWYIQWFVYKSSVF